MVRERTCCCGAAFFVMLLFLCMSFSSLSAFAAGSSGKSSGDGVLSESNALPEKDMILRKLEDLNLRLSKWDKVDKSAFAASNGIPERQVSEQIDRLNSINSYYRRIIIALDKRDTLRAEAERLRNTTAQPIETFIPLKPPFSLSFYQSYIRNDEAMNDRIGELERSLAQLSSALETTRTNFENAKNRVEALSKQVGKAGAGSVPDLDWEYRVALAEEDLYSAAIEFQSIRSSNLSSELETLKLLGERNNLAIEWIRDNLHYDETDLDSQLSGLDKDINDLRSDIEKTEKGKKAVEQKLIKLQAGAETASGSGDVGTADLALNEQQVWWEYYQSRIEHGEEAIQLISEAKSLWTARYSLLKAVPDTETLFRMRDKISKRVDDLQRSILEEQNRISAVNSRLSAAEEDLDKSRNNKDLPYLKGIVSALEKYLEEDHLRYASKLSMVLDMNSRLLDEIESRLDSVQITKKVTTMGREGIMGLLQTKIWSGKGYSLTVRKLILAILILVIGVSVTSKLTVKLKDRLDERNVDPSAVMAIQKITYYVLIITFILITLKMVNIPLTAFAFLGGALAIAVGFGAQNLFSNLITGFIIMLEKPFKVNDIVQVDGTVATVVEIGSRATTVRDFDNVEIMIPNSHFLDNNIINWTHSDRLIRGSVSVGVAYGSPVREVEKILMELAAGHSKVLKRPEPYVVFREFGDSALMFELYFYVDMRNASRFFVASDLRYMIDNVFAKRGIVIAFPQLDVHMNMVRNMPDTGGNPISGKEEGDG